jgi:hypothetical protein
MLKKMKEYDELKQEVKNLKTVKFEILNEIEEVAK